MIKDNEFLEKYNEICDKVSDIIKKVFDSEPVYNNEYLETKLKSCEEKINTIFHNGKLPKEVFYCIRLLVVIIDSVFKMGVNFYHQVFLEECK